VLDRLKFSIFLLIPALALSHFSNQQSTSAKLFFRLAPAKIDQMLDQLFLQFPNFEDRLMAIALDRIGTPYNLKAIGDGAGFDANPVFSISTTNCTAFILTSMALASAQTYQQAEKLMTYLNYYPSKNGENPITYQNRRHFTSDRLLNSPYFKLITDTISEQKDRQTIKLMLNRQENGTHYLPIVWEKEVELEFIPRDKISSTILQRLPRVCGVGIVRNELFAKGIIIGHEGLVFDGKYFVHASRDAGKVIKEDFYFYTQKKRKQDNKFICDGMVVYQMMEVPD